MEGLFICGFYESENIPSFIVNFGSDHITPLEDDHSQIGTFVHSKDTIYWSAPATCHALFTVSGVWPYTEQTKPALRELVRLR